MKLTRDMINDFINEKERQEASENTIRAYKRDVEALYEFMEGREVTQEAMQEYREAIQERYKPQSVHRMMRTANQLLSFSGMGYAKAGNIKLTRNATIKDVLTPVDLKRLLRWADKLGKTKEKIIMETLVSTGIRFGELEYITVEALKTGHTLVMNKGTRREIAIPKPIRKTLMDYCKREKIASGCVFQTKNGTSISNPQLSRALKKIAGAARVKKDKVHPHSFRHLFALNYLDRGGNVLDLRDILGHKNLETTSIYTRTTVKELARKMEETCILTDL